MKTKFFVEKGIVKDQRDVTNWSERRMYTELAAEYGGYVLRTESTPAGQSF